MYDLPIPSLTKKIIRGRAYWYLRECQRVDGKPKIVWQRYLGTAEDLVERLANPSPDRAVVREFGASAACFDISTALDLVAIVDRHVPKRDHRGPSVGEYIRLAALNRCVAPCSKTRLGAWYEQTVLPRLLRMRASQVSSQRFWDNMNRIDEKAIANIERDLCAKVVTSFGLDLRCLLFDATNFFTFVDSFNLRAKLPQRGHSKEGRDNLRLLGLALLVTADGDVPLLHHTYAGNQHDSVTFAEVLPEIARRLRELSEGTIDFTVVFDKGNNSEDNLQAIAEAKMHFVGSLVPTQHPDLLAIGRGQMRRLDKSQLPAVWSYRTRRKVFGVERTVLVTFNRPLFKAQVRTLQREITKRRRRLDRLQGSLDRAARRSGGRKPTLAGTRKRVAVILAGRHMRELFAATVEPGGHDQIPTLRWTFNQPAWQRLRDTLLGKTLLFTDRDEWTDEQIVRGYRSQSHVEAAFRRMKDPHILTFRPIHHWTDHNLRVHALYCVIALTILSLLRRKLAQADLPMSLSRMVELLADIREVALLFPGSKATSPRKRNVLTDLDEAQQRMLRALDLDQHRTA